jgi:hypothetical protein
VAKKIKDEELRAKKMAVGLPGSARHDDNDVQIPADLREVIEDPNDDYEVYFEDPDQLLEIFATLEEKNLFLI